MQVIPVIDLMQGQVVRGVAGRRSEYRPIQSRIASDARPATVARAFVERFGFDTVYVADLDAIVHGQPNVAAWQEVADAGLALWLDAGIGPSHVAVKPQDGRLRVVTARGRIIVSLESLPTPGIVIDLFSTTYPRPHGAEFVFSLDLQEGRPLTRIDYWKGEQALEIVRWVVKAGVERLIVLDLADVGVSGGTQTLTLIRQIRREYPRLEIIAGGGVRGLDDLKALASAGCDAALVASALHDERLTRADIEETRSLTR